MPLTGTFRYVNVHYLSITGSVGFYGFFGGLVLVGWLVAGGLVLFLILFPRRCAICFLHSHLRHSGDNITW